MWHIYTCKSNSLYLHTARICTGLTVIELNSQSILLAVIISENVKTIICFFSFLSDLYIFPQENMTALHIACSNGQLPIVNLLIMRGAQQDKKDTVSYPISCMLCICIISDML